MNKNVTTNFSEAPIVAPRDDVFDACGPPDNTGRVSNLHEMGMGPYKLFDDFYFIGTTSVGAYVIDTGAGLIVIDAGWGAGDCPLMMAQLQEIGLDPGDIEMILISHEHIDHYGCINNWRENYCPSAKVGMSKVGWNYLRTWPVQAGYDAPRPDSIDFYLKDEQIIQLGNKTIKIFHTPGHSPGCVSFVIPVTDRGEKHVIGIMGGSGAPHTLPETLVYWSSVEYFKHVCSEEACDVGLGVHAGRSKDDFDALQSLGPGEPNPLVIGTEKFVTGYLQRFYDTANKAMDVLPKEHWGKTPVEECEAAE